MAYKDSLFRSLFSNETAALGLYNALHRTDYSEQDTEVIINTLGESLFSNKKNDISFLLNRKLVIMVEHESIINQNMPFRFLQPIARIFENAIPNRKAIYRGTRIKLPRPEFIVLYNGTRPFPDRHVLRLSDAYETTEGFEAIRLELEVIVYNINDADHNVQLMTSRSEELRGYAYFVSQSRLYEKEERQMNEAEDPSGITIRAVRRAIQDCKEQGLLVDFFDSLTPEAANKSARRA